MGEKRKWIIAPHYVLKVLLLLSVGQVLRAGNLPRHDYALQIRTNTSICLTRV